MVAMLRKLVGSFMVMAAGAGPLHAAVLGQSAPTRRETLWGLPRNDPAIAIGAIVIVLLLIVGIAWIAARIGDRC